MVYIQYTRLGTNLYYCGEPVDLFLLFVTASAVNVSMSEINYLPMFCWLFFFFIKKEEFRMRVELLNCLRKEIGIVWPRP